MSSFSKIVRFDALRSLAFGSISASYAHLGTAITHVGRLLKIVNNTDGDMIISFDGTTDNDFVPAGGFTLYDFVTNGINSEFVIQVGTQLYVKQSTAPTKNSVYAVLVYGQGE